MASKAANATLQGQLWLPQDDEYLNRDYHIHINRKRTRRYMREMGSMVSVLDLILANVCMASICIRIC